MNHAENIQFIVDDIQSREVEDPETWHKALLVALTEALLKGPDPVKGRDFCIHNLLQEVK